MFPKLKLVVTVSPLSLGQLCRLILSTHAYSQHMLPNDILVALNNKWNSGGVLFDLENAFDCVYHNILLTKRKYYSITGVMYSLIESYLRNRHQSVRFNNRLSNWGKNSYRNSTRINFGALLFFM
jgi:hypothetical protein